MHTVPRGTHINVAVTRCNSLSGASVNREKYRYLTRVACETHGPLPHGGLIKRFVIIRRFDPDLPSLYSCTLDKYV